MAASIEQQLAEALEANYALRTQISKLQLALGNARQQVLVAEGRAKRAEAEAASLRSQAGAWHPPETSGAGQQRQGSHELLGLSQRDIHHIESEIAELHKKLQETRLHMGVSATDVGRPDQHWGGRHQVHEIWRAPQPTSTSPLGFIISELNSGNEQLVRKASCSLPGMHDHGPKASMVSSPVPFKGHVARSTSKGVRRASRTPGRRRLDASPTAWQRSPSLSPFLKPRQEQLTSLARPGRAQSTQRGRFRQASQKPQEGSQRGRSTASARERAAERLHAGLSAARPHRPPWE